MYQVRIFQLRNVALVCLCSLMLRTVNNRVSAFCGKNQSFGSQVVVSQSSIGLKKLQWKNSKLNARSNDRRSASSETGGVTSSLISQLAIIALKLRLPEKTSTVQCDVTATSSDLLMRGQVGPVTVRGKKWKSPLGLTCRVIEATVQSCNLDMTSVLARRKLVLTTPALGDAMIALNSVDFGNFITHPFIKPLPPFDASSGGEIKFLKKDVCINSEFHGGSVSFNASYDGKIWRCHLYRGESGGAIIEVVSQKEDEIVASNLSKYLSKFFNELVFELGGTYLSFKDMMITTKGKYPSIMMALSIKVKKFPSPDLAF